MMKNTQLVQIKSKFSKNILSKQIEIVEKNQYAKSNDSDSESTGGSLNFESKNNSNGKYQNYANEVIFDEKKSLNKINNVNTQFKFSQEQIKEENIKKSISKVNLNNLIYKKKIGSGKLSNIYLVQYGEQYFALKVYDKATIKENNLENQIIEEKKIFEKIGYSFITKYYKSFKDKNFVYLLFEYVDGISFSDLLIELDLFDKFQTQFYLGQLIQTIYYLHLNQIVYRDLKPENIIVRSQDGYIKLIDMNASKILTSDDKNQRQICQFNSGKRTNTLTGTPYYQAPEMIKGNGYSFECDYWAIGVLMFEMVYGYLPFGQDLYDTYDIYEEILKIPVCQILKYDSAIFASANKLIEQLLDSNVESRLSSKNISQIYNHAFFENFNWQQLSAKQIEAPYIPTSNISNNQNTFSKQKISISKFCSFSNSSPNKQTSILDKYF